MLWCVRRRTEVNCRVKLAEPLSQGVDPPAGLVFGEERTAEIRTAIGNGDREGWDRQRI